MTVQSEIFEQVEKILKGFGTTYLTESGGLKRSKLIEDLDKYTPILMKELLSNELIAHSYVETITVGDKTHEIFKLNQFVELFTYKEYWKDSYTKFGNKIGLTAGGKFLDESADVVLDFPFKDCVLKAGMSKEDSKNNDESFLNEIIAKPEIDTLLEPKIFVNATRYDKEHLDGKPTDTFKEEDNLIIKGNNLIALHSIKERYAGKVKLIYIDPPYNTGNDSFNYNDNFNHSAWLTFMKNRLEIARELLSDDGAIFVSLDDKEIAYLRILMDNIFGRQNFVNTFIRKTKIGGGSDSAYGATEHEYVTIFAKNIAFLPEFFVKFDESYLKRYKEEDETGKYFWDTLARPGLKNPIHYDIELPDGTTTDQGWIWSKKRFDEENAKGNIKISKKKDDTWSVQFKQRLNSKGRRPRTMLTDLGGTAVGNSEITKLFGERIFSYPKSEELLEFILSLYTKENDLVLDFFMGSATTQAVAMKMKRRFIGIEQMDYINTVSVERLKKVIDGEQGGISKVVEWQGGDSFVYAELFEKNQGYLKDLLSSSDTTELNAVYQRMVEGGADFDFRVDLQKFDQARAELNFEEQKEWLAKIIDKNQLYYQYSEIEDETVRELVDDNDYKFNKEFYGG